MCDFTPKIPTVNATVPAPTPTAAAPVLSDPFASNTTLGPDGMPIRNQTGLSTLRIDRMGAGAGGLNIPQT